MSRRPARLDGLDQPAVLDDQGQWRRFWRGTDITARNWRNACQTTGGIATDPGFDPAHIFYKDRENRFLRVNRTFAEVMGMPKDRLEGQSIFDLFPRTRRMPTGKRTRRSSLAATQAQYRRALADADRATLAANGQNPCRERGQHHRHHRFLLTSPNGSRPKNAPPIRAALQAAKPPVESRAPPSTHGRRAGRRNSRAGQRGTPPD